MGNDNSPAWTYPPYAYNPDLGIGNIGKYGYKFERKQTLEHRLVSRDQRDVTNLAKGTQVGSFTRDKKYVLQSTAGLGSDQMVIQQKHTNIDPDLKITVTERMQDISPDRWYFLPSAILDVLKSRLITDETQRILQNPDPNVFQDVCSRYVAETLTRWRISRSEKKLKWGSKIKELETSVQAFRTEGEKRQRELTDKQKSILNQISDYKIRSELDLKVFEEQQKASLESFTCRIHLQQEQVQKECKDLLSLTRSELETKYQSSLSSLQDKVNQAQHDLENVQSQLDTMQMTDETTPEINKMIQSSEWYKTMESKLQYSAQTMSLNEQSRALTSESSAFFQLFHPSTGKILFILPETIIASESTFLSYLISRDGSEFGSLPDVIRPESPAQLPLMWLHTLWTFDTNMKCIRHVTSGNYLNIMNPGQGGQELLLDTIRYFPLPLVFISKTAIDGKEKEGLLDRPTSPSKSTAVSFYPSWSIPAPATTTSQYEALSCQLNLSNLDHKPDSKSSGFPSSYTLFFDQAKCFVGSIEISDSRRLVPISVSDVSLKTWKESFQQCLNDSNAKLFIYQSKQNKSADELNKLRADTLTQLNQKIMTLDNQMKEQKQRFLSLDQQQTAAMTSIEQTQKDLERQLKECDERLKAEEVQFSLLCRQDEERLQQSFDTYIRLSKEKLEARIQSDRQVANELEKRGLENLKSVQDQLNKNQDQWTQDVESRYFHLSQSLSQFLNSSPTEPQLKQWVMDKSLLTDPPIGTSEEDWTALLQPSQNVLRNWMQNLQGTIQMIQNGQQVERQQWFKMQNERLISHLEDYKKSLDETIQRHQDELHQNESEWYTKYNQQKQEYERILSNRKSNYERMVAEQQSEMTKLKDKYDRYNQEQNQIVLDRIKASRDESLTRLQNYESEKQRLAKEVQLWKDWKTSRLLSSLEAKEKNQMDMLLSLQQSLKQSESDWTNQKMWVEQSVNEIQSTSAHAIQSVRDQLLVSFQQQIKEYTQQMESLKQLGPDGYSNYKKQLQANYVAICKQNLQTYQICYQKSVDTVQTLNTLSYDSILQYCQEQNQNAIMIEQTRIQTENESFQKQYDMILSNVRKENEEMKRTMTRLLDQDMLDCEKALDIQENLMKALVQSLQDQVKKLEETMNAQLHQKQKDLLQEYEIYEKKLSDEVDDQQMAMIENKRKFILGLTTTTIVLLLVQFLILKKRIQKPKRITKT